MSRFSNTYRDLNEADGARDPFTEERYAQMVRYVGRPSGTHPFVALDVVCHTGRGGPIIARIGNGTCVVGLDIVASRLAQLPPEYDGGLSGLTVSLPIASSSVDVILAGEFIEHLYPADVQPSLEEFWRVLRVGGQLILTTPNPQDVKLRLRGDSVLGGPHLSQHTPASLKHRLAITGFQYLRTRGSGKTSRYLGTWLPLRLYGSFLIAGTKR